MLKDETCFTGEVSPLVKDLLVVEVGILSALTANSVLCPPIRVLQCVWDRCRFCRHRCDFKNLASMVDVSISPLEKNLSM